MAVKKRQIPHHCGSRRVPRFKNRTLENMPVAKTGPPRRKHGGRVFYHLDDLIAWSKNTRRKK